MISADLDALKAASPLAHFVGRRVQLTRQRRSQVGLCPFHRERTPSFHVYRDHYHCFGCGAHGDVFEFVMQSEGVSFSEALDRVASSASLPAIRPLKRPCPPPTPVPNPRALEIWHQSFPVEGTLASNYLAGRNIVVPVGVSGRVLRFHPHCPWRDSPEKPVRFVPALVALFRNIETDEPRAILRRGLTPEGVKLGKPLALGPTAGCAIKLTADEDVEQGLHIGEGVETTLSGMMENFVPAWALGGNLKTFPVLPGIDALTVFVDHDANGVGQAAAAVCSEHWASAGREVFHILPNKIGADMNDVIGGVK